MRKILLIIILLGAAAILSAQTVDSIKVEQAGDFIKIGYKILNSTPDQIFRVRVLCSINGGLNTEIRSISGDTGDNVQGGKPEYFVVWDVLKDVEELKSAEFIVRAELIKGSSARSPGQSRRNLNIVAAAQAPGIGYGLRIGYMGKAGFSGQFIRGRTDYISGYTDREVFGLMRFSMDLTVRLSNKENSQVHLLIGPSLGQQVIEDSYNNNTSYPIHITPGLEFGFAFCQKRTLLILSAARLFPDLSEEGKAITKHTYASFGFGLRF